MIRRTLFVSVVSVAAAALVVAAAACGSDSKKGVTPTSKPSSKGGRLGSSKKLKVVTTVAP